jgi:hypothetical protein
VDTADHEEGRRCFRASDAKGEGKTEDHKVEIDNLNEAGARKYGRRQRRIEQLRRELELIAKYGELHSP